MVRLDGSILDGPDLLAPESWDAASILNQEFGDVAAATVVAQAVLVFTDKSRLWSMKFLPPQLLGAPDKVAVRAVFAKLMI